MGHEPGPVRMGGGHSNKEAKFMPVHFHDSQCEALLGEQTGLNKFSVMSYSPREPPFGDYGNFIRHIIYVSSEGFFNPVFHQSCLQILWSVCDSNSQKSINLSDAPAPQLL